MSEGWGGDSEAVSKWVCFSPSGHVLGWLNAMIHESAEQIDISQSQMPFASKWLSLNKYILKLFYWAVPKTPKIKTWHSMFQSGANEHKCCQYKYWICCVQLGLPEFDILIAVRVNNLFWHPQNELFNSFSILFELISRLIRFWNFFHIFVTKSVPVIPFDVDHSRNGSLHKDTLLQTVLNISKAFYALLKSKGWPSDCLPNP